MNAVRDRALTPAGMLMAGYRLGRYEVLTKLASGGMAVVYVATAQGAGGFERLVAIKVLHANLAHEEEFISMFVDEARLAARIHHPNVVATIDISGTAETGYYLVMEYVEGDHLGGLLASAHKRGERLPVPTVLRVIIETVSALGAAHELSDGDGKPLNIVHRDVSPHNILVGRDGVTRLTDFGVAKAEGRLTHTRDGQVKGKLAYMAPEQASSGATDSRSDLFSAGIVFWECLTGRRLFRAENTAATLVKLLSEPIAPPSAVDPALAPLDPVLKKALDRDPAARFQTAEEFIEAIERAASAVGGVASPRAVSKAVKDYAAEKLARERKLIEAAQRAIRGGTSPDLFVDGTEPSLPSSASQASWGSISMRREKPSAVIAGLTAPRLFTAKRSARASVETATAAPPVPLPPPPPLPIGLGSSFEVPDAPMVFEDEASPRKRALLWTAVFAGVATAMIAAWLAWRGPSTPPEPRAQPLAPVARPAPEPASVLPPATEVMPAPSATEPEPAPVLPPATEVMPAPSPIEPPSGAASAISSTRGAQAAKGGQPSAAAEPQRAASPRPARSRDRKVDRATPVKPKPILPNPYTR